MNNIPLWQSKNFGKVDKIFLMLGPQCNMVCRHCSQTPIKSCVSLNTKMDDKVFTMLDNYIESAIRERAKKNIHFWGGEALLHWNLIKETIIYFTEKYNLLENKLVSFFITSNGLLLTDDKVEFLNNYNVGFTFSYDAPNPWAVRGYVSDEICERVNKIKHCTILSGYNAINCDVVLTYKCLKAKFPKATIVCGYSLIYSFDLPEDTYTYDWNKVRESFRRICMAAYKGYPFAIEYMKRYVPRFSYSKETHKKFIEDGIPACLPLDNVCSVTMDGKLTICHNSDCSVGTIDEPFDVLHEKFKKYFESVRNPLCSTCRHNDYCATGCYINAKDENGAYYNCTKYLIPFIDIAKEELVKLYQGYTEEELAWFKEQNKKDEILVAKFLSGKSLQKGR